MSGRELTDLIDDLSEDATLADTTHLLARKADGTLVKVPSVEVKSGEIQLTSADLVLGSTSSDDKIANGIAIQAAIDAMIANGRAVTALPAGDIYTDRSVYLDKTGNLRGTLTAEQLAAGTTATVTEINFSGSLRGVGGLPNQEGHGTRLRIPSGVQYGVVVGTGQGMGVSDLTVIKETTAICRQALSANSVGIAYAGGSGGSSRNRTSNVGAINFKAGFKTGFNSDTLCDSNSFDKCWTQTCYYGFYISQTQNFINEFYSCNPNYCAVAYYNPVGTPIKIVGGNPSSPGARSKKFNVSGMSSITATELGGGTKRYTFTAVVASPDDYLIGGTDDNSARWCGYEDFIFRTTHFGVIPCTMTAFDSGTSTGTFQIDDAWSLFYFTGVNAQADTALQTQLQACTKVYCNERVTALYGTGIHASGLHIENQQSATTLIRVEQGSGGVNPSRLSGFNMGNSPLPLRNYSPGAAAGEDDLGRYYAQQCKPSIRLVASGLVIEDSNFGQDGGGELGHPILVETHGQRLVSLRNVGFIPNERAISDYLMTTQYGIGNHSGLGFIESDVLPISNNVAVEPYDNFTNGDGRSIMWGHRPAPDSRPRLLPGHVTNFTGTLPAITFTAALSTEAGKKPTMTNDGSSYAANDVLTLVGGTFSQAAQITVDTVDGGGNILTFRVTRGGTYTVLPSSFTVTGGAGTGAAFNVPIWAPTFAIPYPRVWGGHIYSIGDWTVADRTTRQLVSNHVGWTLGRDLTTTIYPPLTCNYKGQTPFLNIPEDVQKLLRRGQALTLDNGSDAAFQVIVREMMPGLDYITVSNLADPQHHTNMPGTKTSTFTMTTIGQEAFAVSLDADWTAPVSPTLA